MRRFKINFVKILAALYVTLCAAVVILWASSYFHAATIQHESPPARSYQFASWRGRLSIAVVDLRQLRAFTGDRFPLTAAEYFADRGDPFGRNSVYGEHFLFSDRGVAGRFWLVPYWQISLPVLLPGSGVGVAILLRRRKRRRDLP